jgi:recyclin-1
MKRNVLASFTNVLLLPVTIVPRAVGTFVTTSSTAAVNGIAMLNPQRWGAQATSGYSADFNKNNAENLLDDGDDSPKEEQRPGNSTAISISHRYFY